jgi:putative N6-adenine-specific DNA methylase
MKYQLVALCPDEIKPVLIKELENLKANSIRSGYKAVSFEVDEDLYYACHLKLATASSLLRVIGKFSLKYSSDLYQQTAKINWHEIFSPIKTFKVDVHLATRGKDHPSSNEVSRDIRLAIQDQFLRSTNKVPKVELKDPEIIICAYYSAKKVTLSINTARTSLHKRGYRLPGHPAPLKETMAAALLHLASYEGKQVFLDPMCGSGTIAIEAAYLALNKAPLIHRKKNEFGFEHLIDFNRSLWRSIQEKVREEKLALAPHQIYAADMDQTYVELAKKTALRARVEKHIQFSTSSFFDLLPPAPTGIIVTNLPYGKRLGQEKELKEFYQNIGDHLKKNYSNWQACLFVDQDSPWKFIGLKPKRKIALLNGSIKTKLLIFELYTGSKKSKKLES